METLINNYGRLIDKIRKDRKKSRPDLCEDIMSVRNFQRFANGEISISNDKIIKLIDRLNLDYFTLNQIYKNASEDEFSKTIKAFNQAIQYNFEEANVLLASIDKDSIVSSYNMQMYLVSVALIKNKKKTLSESNLNSQIERAINFPNILSYNIINIVELNALYALNSKHTLKGDRRITDFFSKVLYDDTFVIESLPSEVIPSIYAAFSKGLYRLNEFEECLDACRKGIEYCKKIERSVGLANLIGYKALAHNKLEQYTEARDSATNLALLLQLEGNTKKSQQYKEVMNSNLGLDLDDLFTIKKGNA